MVGLGDTLELLCILWHSKPAACGRQDGFIEVSGNPRVKLHVLREEAEAWDLPSQAFLKFHQGLVAEEVLEDSSVAISQPYRKSLVGFEEGSCSTQTQ